MMDYGDIALCVLAAYTVGRAAWEAAGLRGAVREITQGHHGLVGAVRDRAADLEATDARAASEAVRLSEAMDRIRDLEQRLDIASIPKVSRR